VNEEAPAHYQNEKSSLWKQTAKHSHANHCHMGYSTIWLKPQVMVWWKLAGYKFIDHDCDG